MRCKSRGKWLIICMCNSVNCDNVSGPESGFSWSLPFPVLQHVHRSVDSTGTVGAADLQTLDTFKGHSDICLVSGLLDVSWRTHRYCSTYTISISNDHLFPLPLCLWAPLDRDYSRVPLYQIYTHSMFFHPNTRQKFEVYPDIFATFSLCIAVVLDTDWPHSMGLISVQAA